MIALLEWHFGFHDNDFAGWLVAASYFVTAILCVIAGRAAKSRGNEEVRGEDVRRRIADHSHVFWYIVAVALALLGINKQLEFQILLTEIGRNVAKADGWYDNRHVLQEDFLVGLAATVVAALAFFGWLIRRTFLRQMFALVGVLALVCFLMIRATSIEHVDQTLRLDLGGVQLHFLLEFGGILIIAITAAVNIALRERKI